MNLLQCLFLLALTGLSYAEKCAVYTNAGLNAGPMMELCDYQKGDPLVLSCKAVKTDASTPRCKDTIDDGNSCNAKITFEIFGSHEDPWKAPDSCRSNTINLLIDVKFSTVYHPIFPSQLNVDRLEIRGGILKETVDDDKLSVFIDRIPHTLIDQNVRHLSINSSEARHLKLSSEVLLLKNLESFTLENMNFGGMSSSSINLANVKNFNMINIGMGSRLASANAIKWNFQAMANGCPSGTATLTLKGITQSQNFDRDSIASKLTDCRGFERKVVVKGGDFFPVIPERMFKSLIKTDQINELSFDPIECCHEYNKWLFDETIPGDRINIECSDLGGQVKSYGQPRRDDECKKRNVMPIYVIAIITIGSLALILTVFGSICFFYVIPRQRAINARSHAESEFHSSAENHVIEMDSNQTKASPSPKRSRSRSRKKGKHVRPTAKLNLAIKNNNSTGPAKRVQATVLKVNSLSDDDGSKQPLQSSSQVSDSATIRTQATAVASKDAKSGVFQTLG